VSILDRMIAAVAPRHAVSRAMARTQLSVLDQTGKRTQPRRRFLDKSDANWNVNTGNPNDGRPARVVNRMAIERLVATNPYARKIKNVLLNNIVGWGITGVPKGSKTLQRLWKDWITVADWKGRRDFYGLQELAVGKMLSPGEVFIVRRYGKVKSGVPLRLQVLGPEMLATAKFDLNITDGIEYDDDDRPIAYHFYKKRPGTARWTNDSIRFPADEVIHLFVEEDEGQRRGNSIFEPVLRKLDDIDDSLEADLVRRKIESCFVGFRTMAEDVADVALGDRETGDDGHVIESFEPGMIETLRVGEDIKFSDPKPAGGLGEAVKINLFATAAGTGVMYEHFGDLSNINYSSYKAGNIEFRRSVGRVTYLTIIPVALDRIFGWFVDDAITLGLVAARTYECKWTPPPFESIDEAKEATGQALQMAFGLESRRNLVNARGYDYEELMSEISDDNATEAKLGLTFNTALPGSQIATGAEDGNKTAAKKAA